MNLLVCLIGLGLITVGALGVANPQHIFTILFSWTPGTLLAVSTTARLCAGIVFLLAARHCRYPLAMRVLGVFCVAASALLLVLGADTLESIVHWAAALPSFEPRAVYALIVLLGAFVFCAGFPGGKRSG